MARVLLVTNDRGIGDPLADLLDREEHEVMWCPGPQSPAFLCVGGRGERCPLAADAEVVVLDGWLASDENRCGVPSWHLLRYYRQRGIPVVALIGPNALPGPVNDPGVITVPRGARTIEIAAAVADHSQKGASV